MKRLLAMVAMLAACCFGQAPKAEYDAAVNVKVSLVDGSQLQGTLQTSSLALVTGFGKKEIPLAQIVSLDFAKDGVKVKFHNKDVLSGTLEGSTFTLRTIFSDVRLNSSQVKSIQFLGGGNTPQGNEPGLLLHALLDSDNENLGAFNAYMEAKNVQIIEGPAGNHAILLGSEEAQITIRLPFMPYAMPEGTIEFWAKVPQPHQRFGGGGGQPWFFNIQCLEYNYIFHFFLGFTSNDGLGKAGLIGSIHGLARAGTHGCGAVSSVAGTGLLGDTPDGWHHYALIWKRDGFELPDTTRKVLLMTIDGNVVASHGGIMNNIGILPHEVGQNPNPDVRLVIHDSNSDCTRPLAMSDLKIWDHAKLPLGI